MITEEANNSRSRPAIRSARPTAQPDVAEFPLDGELVLYDGRTGEAHLLNRTGVQIWRRCDGTHTVAHLARETAVTFGIPYRQALSDVRDLVAALDDADLVTLA